MHTFAQLLTGELKGSTTLRLSCGLTEFPEEIFELADTLEILDLSGNELTVLPQDMTPFGKLKIAFFSYNKFTEFPKSLADCPCLEMIGFKANLIHTISEDALPPLLRWLILTDNQINTIPSSIGKCHQLQKLMLAGNQLRLLPEEMSACVNLELLRISANQLNEFPTWLFSLPRLSWLAYAANPFVVSNKGEELLESFIWEDLVLFETLGQGASGIISRAEWKGEEVAVKVFKGAVTSDGLPEDEMAACLASGKHPHLVPVRGKILEHPSQKQALMLDLIPSGFKNLGGPPNFQTCTRDVFLAGTGFSHSQIMTIAKGISSVCRHLHARGIMHGDLYAHNILIDEKGNPLLGDFGAATRYDRSNMALSFFLERLEVRAFGSLLDDLLGLLEAEMDAEIKISLLELRDICLLDDVSQRPDFESICSVLRGINEYKSHAD